MIRRRKRARKLNAEINVVPYIDVMMVLLVIFMVAAPLMTQGVKVELPDVNAESVDSKEDEPIVISVDINAQYYIDVGGDATEPVSAEVVQDRVRKILATNQTKLLLVRGDKGVNYDAVVKLMVLLQGAGATSVGLVTE